MRFLRVGLSIVVLTALAVPAQAAAVGGLKQYRVPTPDSAPRYITNGSDGNVWFTESSEFLPAAIGRITPAGKVTEFPVDCNFCILNDIEQGPGGILYYTSNEDELGRISTSGTQLSAVPMPDTDVLAGSLAIDGDDIWITDFNNNSLWRYSIASGLFTQFVVPTEAATPADVAVDPAGTVWFTESGGGNIGRLDPSTGVIAEVATGVFPRGIAVAADGQVWFTSRFTPQAVGRLDPADLSVTLFPVSGGGPHSIAAAPSGPLWFTQTTRGNIASIDNAGVITESRTIRDSQPFGITVGGTGDPWYTMMAANKIAVLQLR